MKTLRQFILVGFLLISLSLWSAIPVGYYSNAEGKSSETLRQALSTIVTTGHSVVSYTGLWTGYGSTDLSSDGKTIMDMYSTYSFVYQTDQCGTYTNVGDCYNREHSVPKSWFNDASPMISDIVHVVPTDGKVNGQRSNYPFGECATGTNLGSYALGKLGTSTFSGYTSVGTVFEPDDTYKGDFARIYFYMATRYASGCSSWTGGMFGNMSGLTDYSVALLLKWHRQDPVSAKEQQRNEGIQTVQNNRNPFVDYPDLAEHIWGTKSSVPFYISSTPTTPVAPTLGTTSVSGVTSTSATVTASVSADGGATVTEKGIYYSTTTGFANGTGIKLVSSSTGIGSYNISLSGLTSNTAYYYKAYATNSAGTTYSSQNTFTTTANSSTNGPEIQAGNPIPSSSVLTFGTTTSSVTKALFIKCKDLTSDLTVSLSGTNSSMFSLSESVISNVSALSGFYLMITYTPTTSGTHVATLTISGTSLNYSITLSGQR